MRLSRETFSNNIGKFFGTQDIEIGEQEFDKLVLVQGNEPDEIIRFLTPRRRKLIGAALRSYANLIIDENNLVLEVGGSVNKFEDLSKPLWDLLELAEALMPPEVAEIKPEPEPVPEPEPELPPALEAATFIAEIFSRKKSSGEATHQFEATMRDQDIAWQGKLKSATRYSFDLVFEDGAGTRAVIDIGSTEGVTDAGDIIHAVLQLPEDAAETLRSKAGDDLAFTGRLVKVDTIMRTIRIADGTLTSAVIP